jgi:hypothetical protein
MLRSVSTAALVVSPLTGSAQPHLRTNPNHNPSDNYGFPGQYTPNTGRTRPG